MKADIFFFVTTIAVVFISIALLIASIYLIVVLKNAAALSKRVKEEGVEIVKEIGEARASIRKNGLRIGDAIGFIRALFTHKHKKHHDNQE